MRIEAATLRCIVPGWPTFATFDSALSAGTTAVTSSRSQRTHDLMLFAARSAKLRVRHSYRANLRRAPSTLGIGASGWLIDAWRLHKANRCQAVRFCRTGGFFPSDCSFARETK
jgi:hypothetical protein